MEARITRPAMGVATVLFLFASSGFAQFGRQREYVEHTQNFIIFAASPQWAAQVAEVAERNRRELALHWLGRELPAWSERVPVHVKSGPQLGAAGETRFSLLPGGVGNWMMSVQGTPERVLDSVLPHEITHTIFATHFAPMGKYVPRWADEGACTTVEHEAEKVKHEHYLKEFLRTGRGLAFNKMFSLKEYPHDILPLYAQGHSAVQFLIDQGGAQKFIRFIELGMQTENWEASLTQHYTYESIGQFQTMWNQWLRDGSPDDLLAYAPGLRPSGANGSLALASATQGPTGNQFALESNAADESGVPPLQLVASQAEPRSSGQMVVGKESWYKRRLREIHSGAATSESLAVSDSAENLSTASQPQSLPGQVVVLPASDVTSLGQVVARDGAPQTGLRGVGQSTGRVMPAQSPTVQVLDWGHSVPIPGLQP